MLLLHRVDFGEDFVGGCGAVKSKDDEFRHQPPPVPLTAERSRVLRVGSAIFFSPARRRTGRAIQYAGHR
jgi:hypothetical protein